MKAWQLIKALEEGKRLIKDYKLCYPDNAKDIEQGERVSKYQFDKLSGRFTEKSFGCEYLITHAFILVAIFANPEHYQIEGQEQDVINEYCKCKM